MRTWRLTHHDPYALTLAADAQLSSPDYCNDTIWELVLAGGEPSALAIQTTFGLRARIMRIFPRFTLGDTTLVDPDSFTQLPTLCQFYVNYARVTCSPFAGMDVTSEYWVPNSQCVSGRLRVSNTSIIPRQISIEMISLLTPMSEGQEMHPEIIQDGSSALAGQTGNLNPVFLMKDGKELRTSPYPAYITDLELMPGNTCTFNWALGAAPEVKQSFAIASELLNRTWDAEIGRLTMQSANQVVDIQTGDPDWDAALAFSQIGALQLFFGQAQKLPYPSFVLSRQPDQGYSRRYDGSDYGHLWNGQTALDTFYLASLIMPGSVELVKGLLINFLGEKTENGQVDGKPGLAGQQGHFLATPVLAALAWQVYQTTHDQAFLLEIFPALLNFINAWFGPDHDHDQDGFPEWENGLQSGFEENPTFDNWRAAGLSNDIDLVESPALGALLYHELNVLIQIARELAIPDSIAHLESRAAVLKSEIESTWESRQACYHYRDRDSHQTATGTVIGEFSPEDEIVLDKKFKKPQRLMIVLEIHGEATRSARFLIHGTTPTGQSDESITVRMFHWAGSRATATTQNVFIKIDGVEIHGLSPSDKVILKIPDIGQDDITLLLPLWARIPGDRQANNMIKKSILSSKRYWRPFGIAACPAPPSSTEPGPCPNVYLPWVHLIGEGLIAYGYQNETAELIKKVLAAVIRSLKQDHAFYKLYNAENGDRSGDKNVLSGFAPVGLFLQTLGVHIISPTHVIIIGNNPFSRPMTVKFRGLSIVREEKSTTITFPDGQSTRVTGLGAHHISLA